MRNLHKHNGAKVFVKTMIGLHKCKLSLHENYISSSDHRKDKACFPSKRPTKNEIELQKFNFKILHVIL